MWNSVSNDAALNILYLTLFDYIWNWVLAWNVLLINMLFQKWLADITILSRVGLIVRLIFSNIPALGEYCVSRLGFEKGSAPAWQLCGSWTAWWAPEAQIWNGVFDNLSSTLTRSTVWIRK